ncbi:MAG: hypothetical protein ACRC12_02795 [Holosporales bacterium]|jgi:hypothetical protein
MRQQIYFLGGILLTVGSFSGCSSERRANAILQNGWVGPTTTALEAQKKLKPLFCYRTIGDPECFSKAQKGSEDRLIGFYMPSSLGIPEKNPHDSLENNKGKNEDPLSCYL